MVPPLHVDDVDVRWLQQNNPHSLPDELCIGATINVHSTPIALTKNLSSHRGVALTPIPHNSSDPLERPSQLHTHSDSPMSLHQVLEVQSEERRKQSGSRKQLERLDRSADDTGIQTDEISNSECAACFGLYDEDLLFTGELVQNRVECTQCKRWMHSHAVHTVRWSRFIGVLCVWLCISVNVVIMYFEMH